MISALILPLFLAGTQGSIGAAPGGDPAIRLWINNDGRFLPGDHAEVQVRTRDDGYLLVLHADPDGQLRVLFPLDSGDDNFVRGGERYEVKGRGGPDAFDIGGAWGQGVVYAAVSRDRFRFDGYRLGDDWDYGALAPSQVSSEAESELTDLVSRMAPGDFDYDVVTLRGDRARRLRVGLQSVPVRLEPVLLRSVLRSLPLRPVLPPAARPATGSRRPLLPPAILESARSCSSWLPRSARRCPEGQLAGGCEPAPPVAARRTSAG